jgi:hypothetical protein
MTSSTFWLSLVAISSIFRKLVSRSSGHKSLEMFVRNCSNWPYRGKCTLHKYHKYLLTNIYSPGHKVSDSSQSATPLQIKKNEYQNVMYECNVMYQVSALSPSLGVAYSLSLYPSVLLCRLPWVPLVILPTITIIFQPTKDTPFSNTDFNQTDAPITPPIKKTLFTYLFLRWYAHTTIS